MASVSTTRSTASSAVPMGSLQRETAAFATIIAERLPKPQESRAQSSWLRERPRGASHLRDVDGCEYVDSFWASGFATRGTGVTYTLSALTLQLAMRSAERQLIRDTQTEARNPPSGGAPEASHVAKGCPRPDAISELRCLTTDRLDLTVSD